MCGIFGGIKDINADTIKILGICNETRGTDSTGLFDKMTYIKDNVSFRDFLLKDDTDYIKKFKKYLVGHTRFATTGKVSLRNAHPFSFGGIVGVHNGIIRNFDKLKKTYDAKELECDSEIIFYLLDKKGIEGLKELDGYYTIVWSDNKTPNILYFLSHDAGLSYIREKEYIYFSSSKNDLLTALGKKIKPVEFENDVLYKVDITTLKIVKEKIKGLFPYRTYTSYYPNKKLKKTKHNQNCTTYDIFDENDEYFDAEWNKKVRGFNDNSEINKIENETFNREYMCICPYCNNGLYVDEIHKEKCPYCNCELTGIIYSCYHCDSLVMLEQVEENDICPICNMHMVLAEKYLVKESY